MNWRGMLDLFRKSCVWGGAGRGKIICQPGKQSRQLEKAERGKKQTKKNWSKPVESVRSKDLKSDLEIMLTQLSSCVCAARALPPGSQVALRGVTDHLHGLGVACPWSKPKQHAGAWREQDRDHCCLPDLFMPWVHRMLQAKVCAPGFHL